MLPLVLRISLLQHDATQEVDYRATSSKNNLLNVGIQCQNCQKALSEVQNNSFEPEKSKQDLTVKVERNPRQISYFDDVIHEVSRGRAASQHNSLSEEILYQTNQQALRV